NTGLTPTNNTHRSAASNLLISLLWQVSKEAADLMAYCDAHACNGPLITPVPTSENPFREKKFFCALL
uniref:Guanine nucleotide-binding protein subunit gamma n=1 Tax=Salarias fasciatus TaxID=181472 RepID=A0A672ICY3_SALFA